MLRAVLAVLVVAAIFAVSQPVIQQGRQNHAGTLLADEAEGLVEQADDLVKTDEAVDSAGARRIVTVRLPAPRRFSAGAHYVEIHGGEPSTIEWAVDGGSRHRRVLEGFRFRTSDGEPLRLEGGGDHRLVLGLTGPPGDPIVVVRRFDPPRGASNG